MSGTFEVSIISATDVHTLPDIWPVEAFRRLLELAEFEEAQSIPDSDLLDMTLMVLQDLGNQRAGEFVLQTVFGETMRPGVRQNLVDDLQEDEPWSDYAVVGQQKGLFIAVVLLQQAFPNRYGVPDARFLRFSVRALSEAGVTKLDNPTPSWLMRLLGAGMKDTNVLHRLYETELAGAPFPDAPDLIWHLEPAPPQHGEHMEQRKKTFDLVSSRMWLGPLQKGQVFRATPPIRD